MEPAIMSVSFFGEKPFELPSNVQGYTGVYRPIVKVCEKWKACHPNMKNESGRTCKIYACQTKDRSSHLKLCKSDIYHHDAIDISSPRWIENVEDIPYVKPITDRCKFTWKRKTLDVKPRKHKIIIPLLEEANDSSDDHHYDDEEENENEDENEDDRDDRFREEIYEEEVNLDGRFPTVDEWAEILAEPQAIPQIPSPSITPIQLPNVVPQKGTETRRQVGGPLSKQVANMKKGSAKIYRANASYIQDWGDTCAENETWLSYSKFKTDWLESVRERGVMIGNFDEGDSDALSSRDATLMDVAFHLTQRYVNQDIMKNNNKFYKT